MQHHFNVDLAKSYGVEVAIFLDNILFWVNKNYANNVHFHDGNYWTYNTRKAFTLLFPYWSVDQIKRIIKKCLDEQLMISGNYNHNKYDQTKWYTITPKLAKLLNYIMWPNRPIDLVTPPNDIGDIAQPIPDNKPDIKPALKSFCTQDQKKINEQKHSFAENMNKLAAEKKYSAYGNNYQKSNVTEIKSTIKEWKVGNPDYDRYHKIN